MVMAWAIRGAVDYLTLRILLLRGGNVHPHPGPPTAAYRRQGTLGIATLNAPGGLHVVRRDRVGTEQEEGWGDGWDLLTKPSAKLATVCDEIKRKQLSLLVVSETRMHECEKEAVTGQLRRMQYDHKATCGRTDEGSKQTVSGVSIIWDPSRLRLAGDMKTVVPHRVLRATFEVVGSTPTTCMTVYGAYMPQRRGMDAEVREAWSAVATDAVGKDGIWVMGDMNAEMRDVIERC